MSSPARQPYSCEHVARCSCLSIGPRRRCGHRRRVRDRCLAGRLPRGVCGLCLDPVAALADGASRWLRERLDGRPRQPGPSGLHPSGHGSPSRMDGCEATERPLVPSAHGADITRVLPISGRLNHRGNIRRHSVQRAWGYSVAHESGQGRTLEFAVPQRARLWPCSTAWSKGVPALIIRASYRSLGQRLWSSTDDSLPC